MANTFRRGDLLRLTGKQQPTAFDLLVIYLEPCGCGEKSHIKVHPLFEDENEVIYDSDTFNIDKVGHVDST